MGHSQADKAASRARSLAAAAAQVRDPGFDPVSVGGLMSSVSTTRNH